MIRFLCIFAFGFDTPKGYRISATAGSKTNGQRHGKARHEHWHNSPAGTAAARALQRSNDRTAGTGRGYADRCKGAAPPEVSRQAAPKRGRQV